MNPAETLPDQDPLSLEDAQNAIEELNALQQSLLAYSNRFRGRAGVDQRWLAIGVTDIEKGVMSVSRAIAEAPLKAAEAQLKKLLADIPS